MSVKRTMSKGSFYIKDIKSFVYGGFGSRFWLMRKHINSIDMKDLADLPFYCWECITIYTQQSELNLVIKDQKDMKHLLEFLIVSLETADGYRGTAKAQVDCVLQNLYSQSDNQLEFDQEYNTQKVMLE